MHFLNIWLQEVMIQWKSMDISLATQTEAQFLPNSTTWQNAWSDTMSSLNLLSATLAAKRRVHPTTVGPIPSTRLLVQSSWGSTKEERVHPLWGSTFRRQGEYTKKQSGSTVCPRSHSPYSYEEYLEKISIEKHKMVDHWKLYIGF